MPEKQIPFVFERLSQIPVRYRILASELSDRLVAIESRLNQLPSKIQTSVLVDSKPPLVLGFGRVRRERWSILVLEPDLSTFSSTISPEDIDLSDAIPLLDSSIDVKIRASQYINLLLHTIVNRQTDGLSRLEQAIASIGDVERALGIKKEGQ
ncbi:MAG: hypothetical protein IT434_01105 [Phycisphaerales bacterium]|jgi:hypothetical protein|nr:hypothetical protein [Phycisphaerales bacterium]